MPTPRGAGASASKTTPPPSSRQLRNRPARSPSSDHAAKRGQKPTPESNSRREDTGPASTLAKASTAELGAATTGKDKHTTPAKEPRSFSHKGHTRPPSDVRGTAKAPAAGVMPGRKRARFSAPHASTPQNPSGEAGAVAVASSGMKTHQRRRSSATASQAAMTPPARPRSASKPRRVHTASPSSSRRKQLTPSGAADKKPLKPAAAGLGTAAATAPPAAGRSRARTAAGGGATTLVGNPTVGDVTGANSRAKRRRASEPAGNLSYHPDPEEQLYWAEVDQEQLIEASSSGDSDGD